MKATTARPVNAPMTSDSPRKTWLSRCRSTSMRSESGNSTNSCPPSGGFHLGYRTWGRLSNRFGTRGGILDATGILASWRILNSESMGRNLYSRSFADAVCAVSCGLAYTNIAQQPGSPGDASLWRTMGWCCG